MEDQRVQKCCANEQQSRSARQEGTQNDGSPPTPLRLLLYNPSPQPNLPKNGFLTRVEKMDRILLVRLSLAPGEHVLGAAPRR